MNGMHDPGELSAHALGLLGGAQARAVEQHLTDCAACRREWSELRETATVLDSVPPEMFLDGPPENDLLLQRTLRQIRAETGARRNRRRFGLAVAAALVAAALLGAGTFVGQQLAPEPTVIAAPPPAGARTDRGRAGTGHHVRDDHPGQRMGPAGGQRARDPPDERCSLIIIGRDGSEHLAGSWVVGKPGPVRGRRCRARRSSIRRRWPR